MGFCCSGKSTITDMIQKQMKRDSIAPSISFVDTDKEVCKRLKKRHIYQIYEEYVSGPDRQKALSHIEAAENDFLSEFKIETEHCLIAFGPFVPSRKNWNNFVNIHNPVNVFLKIDPATAYNRLKFRRSQQLEDLSSYKSLGSWDQGVLTYFDESTNSHADLSKEDSLKKISELIEYNESNYYKPFVKSFAINESRDCRTFVIDKIQSQI